MDSYGFIITRHVNSEKTNKYWNKCVRCIRKFYPLRKIIIIDDNSNSDFIKADFLISNPLKLRTFCSLHNDSGSIHKECRNFFTASNPSLLVGNLSTQSPLHLKLPHFLALPHFFPNNIKEILRSSRAYSLRENSLSI